MPIANTAVAFNKVYTGLQRPPWDTDGPTPFVQDLVQAGQVRGEVLDAGCGTGENAIYLAVQGYRVVAFDAAPAAIEKARVKARQRGVAATFAVADARELMAWDARFETIIDSGLFHVMGKNADRLRYARALRRVSRPGAVFHYLHLKTEVLAGWGASAPGSAFVSAALVLMESRKKRFESRFPMGGPSSLSRRDFTDGERSALPASGGFESAQTKVRISSSATPLRVQSSYHAQA